MSRFGSANYCAICEKKIPWSAKCIWCRGGICSTCKCTCQFRKDGTSRWDTHTFRTPEGELGTKRDAD